MIKGIGPAFMKRNRNRLAQSESCLQIVEENKPAEIDSIPHLSKVADSIIKDCQFLGIEIIDFFSHDYPWQLLEISDPPSVLYIKGNKSLLKNVIAIIGTRHSTPLGNKIAERLGQYFSNKFSICNGLVEGIDEHSIYIDGKVLPNVVGIISGGLNYTETCIKAHIRVIEDVIQADGLIVSEFPPQQKEDKYSGSKASRIQAGLSQGLILVQSSIDGGSKYTLASYAKLKRVLGIVHVPSVDEYNLDVFGANRLIVEKHNSGVAEMIGFKKADNINIRSIITVEGKNNYEEFENEVFFTIRGNELLFL